MARKLSLNRLSWRYNFFFIVSLCVHLLLCSLLVYSKVEARIIWIVVLLILIYLILFLLFVIRPLKGTEKILSRFASGYTLDDIYDISHPFSAGMEGMVERIRKLLNSRELLQAGKRQEQFLALQNQINPHFLYNTLEGIRSEALGAGVVSIAEMTEALSRFFRYTISSMDHLVSLEDELDNVQTYFLIQQYRFGKRLHLKILQNIDSSARLSGFLVPKLILQPIVENAIIHGLERKVGEGLLTIRIEQTRENLIITISDDGVGMTRDTLREVLELLAERRVASSESHRGIAVLNVNNRIKLHFGEQYGICVSSVQNVGTDVEITLPSLAGQV
ncbi:MAG: histidine kinase [Spirochaetales bacterium]|nr:histidine kinase [Spirochaetales bacterium]